MGAKQISRLILIILAITLVASQSFGFGIEFFAPKTQSVTFDKGETTSFRMYGTPEDESAKVSYQWYLDDKLVSNNPYYIFDADQEGDHVVNVVILEETDPPKEYHSHWDITVQAASKGSSSGTEEGASERECVGVWLCTLWTECQEDGTSTRECEEIRCGKTSGGPETLKQCEYVPPPAAPEVPVEKEPEDEPEKESAQAAISNEPQEPENQAVEEIKETGDDSEDDLSGITGGVIIEDDNGDKGMNLKDFFVLVISLFVIGMLIIIGARTFQAKRKDNQSPNRSSPTFLQ